MKKQELCEATQTQRENEQDWNTKIKQFTDYLTLEKNFSANTKDAYKRDTQKLAFYSLESLDAKLAEDITFEDLQEFLFQQTKRKLSERTQARWVSSIKVFFKFLVEEQVRQDNPASMLEGPKLGLYLPDTLSEECVQKIIKAVDLEEQNGQRNHCMIEVLYGCGLRVSELIDLKISNINFKEGYLNVEGKGGKIRSIPLAEYTAHIILDYINQDRHRQRVNSKYADFVFINSRGTNLSRVMVFIIIKELAEKANIYKKISPHTFRHSFATHLLQNGADIRFIQEMLGHSSITTTEIYTHIDTKDLRAAILNYHPRCKTQQ